MSTSELERLAAARDRHRARLTPFCLIWGSLGFSNGRWVEDRLGDLAADSISLALTLVTLVVVFRYVRWLSRTSRSGR